jgi:outer membrane protein assembly factor BamB
MLVEAAMKSRHPLLALALAFVTLAPLARPSDAQQCTGLGEIMGSDMSVSLAPSTPEVSMFTHGPVIYSLWNENGTTPTAHSAGDYKMVTVAGVLMHEIGHNLGLPHGGAVLTANGSAALYVTSDNGHLDKIDPETGVTLASVDLRRLGCSGDQLTATPAVQLYNYSNQAFQSAMLAIRGTPDDLVYVATHHGCGDTSGNEVIAYFGSDLSVAWVFNPSGTYSMSYASDGCEVDYANNQVYCGTNQATPGQSTLWALESLPTGAGAGANLKWSYNAGSLSNRPVLAAGRLYVLPSGNIQAIDPISGSPF